MGTVVNQIVQMNVRLGRVEKQRGDAALAAMGFSPTEAVRAIWALATGSARDLDNLKDLLCKGRALSGSKVDSRSGEAADTLLEAGWALYAQACVEVGLTGKTDHGLSDEELLEQVLLERYGES